MGATRRRKGTGGVPADSTRAIAADPKRMRLGVDQALLDSLPARPTGRAIGSIAELAYRDSDGRRFTVQLLLRLFGISTGPNELDDLVLHMADRYYWPSLSPKKGGRPRRWSAWTNALLVVEVRRLLNEGRKRKWIFATLSEHRHWSELIQRRSTNPDPSEALRSRFDKTVASTDPEQLGVGCCRFQRHLVKVEYETGGGRWEPGGSSARSTSSRR